MNTILNRIREIENDLLLLLTAIYHQLSKILLHRNIIYLYLYAVIQTGVILFSIIHNFFFYFRGH